MISQASRQVVVMVAVPVVTTHPHILCTFERRLINSLVCCTLMGKVQIDEPSRKKHVLVSRSFLDQELSYFDTTNPGDKRVFWAHVVARVRGPCRGTCSESMLWDVFEAYVVGDVVGLCFGMCSGPIFWDMVGAYVLGHGLGLYCGMCSPLMLWKVPRAHVLRTHVLSPVLGLCCETYSGPLLSDLFGAHVMKLVRRRSW